MFDRPLPDTLGQPSLRHPVDPSAGSTRSDGGAYGPERSKRSRPDGLAGVEVQFLHYVRVLYKRRWTACTAFVVVVLILAVYLLTATPIYEASTRLLIEAEKQNVVTFKPVLEEENAPADAYFQTQYKLLESRALAAKTIETLRLWDNPELCVSCRAHPTGMRSRAGAALESTLSGVRQLFGQSSARIDANRTGETPEKSEVIDAFLDRLVILPIRNSRLVDIRFRSTDASLAAQVANGHARGFINRNLEFKFLTSKEASDWLGERLTEQRQKLEQSESAVQQYREQHDGVSLEDRQNIVVQKLNDISAAVTRAKTQRIEKEALYRQVQAVEHDRTALDTFPAVLSNTFIQQLKHQVAELHRQRAQLADRLGEKHPDMIKVMTEIQAAEEKLQREIDKVVFSVRNDYHAAEAQELSLIAALETQKRDALALNRKGIQGNVLKRDAESNRQLYEGLLQRAKETGVSNELKTSNVRLVDPAEVPRSPVSPNKAQILLIAFVGGTLLGVTLAFFFENLDDRIKTPEEITNHLGMATLGLVPRIAQEQLGAHPLISNGVPLNFAEAFRTVRTSVLFSFPEREDRYPNTLVVTSTAPGEGKTTSSCNLALGIALAGQRVLLIDCDMRRPSVHEMFDIEQEPGLSNLLVGNARAADVVHASGVTNLCLLPAGRVPPNPSELLSSQRFKDFLSGLVGHFDWVVMDSSPVLAVTDASIVARIAHGIVFVIGAELTSHRAAAEAVERLERADGRLIGAVLNRVNLDRHPYYYSQYYRREYGDYYTGKGRRASAN